MPLTRAASHAGCSCSGRVAAAASWTPALHFHPRRHAATAPGALRFDPLHQHQHQLRRAALRARLAPPRATPANGGEDAQPSSSGSQQPPAAPAAAAPAASAAAGQAQPPAAAAASSSSSSGAPNNGNTTTTATASAPNQQQPVPFSSLDEIDDLRASQNFCIIEGRDSVKDFAGLQLEEVRSAIAARRARIFLLMEEVRRLRIQQRLKGGELPPAAEVADEPYLSALPFLPPLTDKTLSRYWTFYLSFVGAVIVFGGLLAPLLEVRMGLGGTTYAQVLEGAGLPRQLAAVDPIVASFCGGAVGVLSALLVVEQSNVKKQRRGRCHYCEGTGYLLCGSCMGSGVDPALAGVGGGGLVSAAASGGSGGSGGNGGGGGGCSCPNCSGTGKVMCTGCLATGKQFASEHTPQLDPFN